jgi:hypothetical protein
MEKIKLEFSFELVSNEINKFSRQLSILKLQKGNSWVVQKINNYRTLVAANLDTGLISQEEYDVLLEEIDYMTSKLSNPS